MGFYRTSTRYFQGKRLVSVQSTILRGPFLHFVLHILSGQGAPSQTFEIRSIFKRLNIISKIRSLKLFKEINCMMCRSGTKNIQFTQLLSNYT